MTNVVLDLPGNMLVLFVMINEANYNNSIMLRVVRAGLRAPCVCNKSFLWKDNCSTAREEKTQLGGQLFESSSN